MDSKPVDGRPEHESSRADRALPELLRKVFEAGVERLGESKEMRQRLADLKLPKEALHGILHQLDESKSGLYRALAHELRDFLEQTNFSDELVKALTKLRFELKTEVRFVRADTEGDKQPKVDAQVRVKSSSPPNPPTSKTPKEPNP